MSFQGLGHSGIAGSFSRNSPPQPIANGCSRKYQPFSLNCEFWFTLVLLPPSRASFLPSQGFSLARRSIKNLTRVNIRTSEGKLHYFFFYLAHFTHPVITFNSCLLSWMNMQAHVHMNTHTCAHTHNHTHTLTLLGILSYFPTSCWFPKLPPKATF